MASVIKIKRSNQSVNAPTLVAGELAYSFAAGGVEDNGGRLFFGTGSGNQVIGGKYFTDFLDHTPGTLTASSALLVDANSKVNNFKVDNLDFDGNTISSTNSNGNISITPNGTGVVVAAKMEVSDLTATRVTFAGENGRLVDSTNLTFTTATGKLDINAGEFEVDNLNLNGNTISSTDTNGNISITPNGTGKVVMDDLNFDGSTISSTLENGSINITPTGTGKVNVDNIALDANTISTTDTNGNLTLSPNGTGTVVAPAGYKDRSGFGNNSFTTKEYVDGAISNNAALTVDADSGTDVSVNLSADDLQFVSAPNLGLSTSVAKVNTDVTVTFTLAQDIRTSASPTFVGLTLSGDAAVNGGDITTTQTSFNLVNATATTVNFAGAATTLSIGAASGTTTINNANTVVTGDLAVNGGDITTSAATFNLLDTTATTINFGGAATAISIGAATGTTTVENNLTVAGNLTVNGTTTTVNSTTLLVDDPMIKLADGNAANSLDIGFFGEYSTDAGVTASFTGLFRDASDSNKYKLFATGTVTNNVVNTESGFTLAELVAIIDGGEYI